MGEGRVSLTPCADFYRPVEELEYKDLHSDFPAHPVLNPLVTLYFTPSSRKDFFEGKNFFSHQVLSRVIWSPKMGDGSVIHTPCRLVQTCRRMRVYLSSEEHLHRSLTRQGIQDMTDSGNVMWHGGYPFIFIFYLQYYFYILSSHFCLYFVCRTSAHR